MLGHLPEPSTPIPPPYRTSQSDPFDSRNASTSVLGDNASQMSGMGSMGRPDRGGYSNMEYTGAPGGAAMAGAGAGYGGQFSDHGFAGNGGGGYGTPPSGYARGENLTADELWERENGQGGGARSYGYSDPEPPARGSKLKWILIGVAALIVIAVAVAVPVAITMTKNHSSGSSNSSKSTGKDASLPDPNDPSNFDKDPAFHNVFWGMAYEPQGGLYPACGATQANVTRDIQMLSQLTTRLRLYGANCNVTALVLQAIQDTKVDMTIYPAIYVDSNDAAFTEQLKAITDAFDDYGVDHVDGLAVGNEFLLNSMADAGSTSPTGAAYTAAVKTLSAKIATTKSAISGKYSKDIPIGTGDAGSMASAAIAQVVDFFMANVHPWFASTTIDDAAGWTYSYFEESVDSVIKAGSPDVVTYIAETGWPSKSSDAESANDGAGSPQGDASIANLQTFLDTYVCAANKNNTGYFYFEPFDQPWKDKLYGGVEGWWGIFGDDRKLKDGLTIPTCS